MQKNYILLIFIIGLIGCSHTTKPKLNISITVDEPNRIRFQGKGAGAGMMLSGSMGVMGVAIGVAIDEGIGKTIEDTAKQHNINFKSLFEKQLELYLTQNRTSEVIKSINVYISRYGFKTTSGDNDPVSAEVIGKITLNEQTYIINYPINIQDNTQIPTQPLAIIKEDADSIALLFNQSIKLILHTQLPHQ